MASKTVVMPEHRHGSRQVSWQGSGMDAPRRRDCEEQPRPSQPGVDLPRRGCGRGLEMVRRSLMWPRSEMAKRKTHTGSVILSHATEK